MEIEVITNRQTTYILLSRGDEDRQLGHELDRIAHQIGGLRELAEMYPKISQLRHGINKEIRDQDNE